MLSVLIEKIKFAFTSKVSTLLVLIFLSNISLDAQSTPIQSVAVDVGHLSCINTQGHIYLQVTPSGSYLYDWVGPNGFTSSNKDIEIIEEGEYMFSVTNSSSTDQYVDTVMVEGDYEIPNSYTGFTINCDSTALLSGYVEDTSAHINYKWYGPSIISSNKDTCCVLVDSIGAYYFETWNSSNGCVNVVSTSILSLGCSSNSAPFSIDNMVVVYPNPFDVDIHIDSQVPYKRMVISDFRGKVIHQSEFQDSYNVDFLACGIYFFGFEFENDVVWRKLVKGN